MELLMNAVASSAPFQHLGSGRGDRGGHGVLGSRESVGAAPPVVRRTMRNKSLQQCLKPRLNGCFFGLPKGPLAGWPGTWHLA